jgi:2-isopropylmalate synthase
MKQILISDATMKQSSDELRLSFKEKIELSKLLDKLGVDLIELDTIKNPRVDSLLIKSIVSAAPNSRIAVPVELSNEESLERTWAALKNAKNPRLQVCASTSSVQIEYLFHKKPEAMLDAISRTVSACRALCDDVEFIAQDATRSDSDFLASAIEAAISSGATTITLCDTAGTMLPSEFVEFIRNQYSAVPKLSDVILGVCCANTIAMADACAVMAIKEGAGQIRASAYTSSEVCISNIAQILTAKADSLSASVSIKANQLSRIIAQIERLCHSGKSQSIESASEHDDEILLTAHDSEEAVIAATVKLGYDLSAEDAQKVYAAFKQIAGKKEGVSLKELDAIVASCAMQVPPTYKLDTYVITSGNTISATAHIKLTKNDSTVEGVYIGDGSIDAAFQAIEKITGCHFELDDFQLQAVTEGREAMGQTVVKLRAGDKVYSGVGISTDIVGAGIQAYLSALNKILYEEEIE